MSSKPIPSAALANHIAILGKTGSGKTSTEKLAVEQVVADGVRVCVLDPIKSDWWGVTSSADGKRPGLPFRILGGPRGHVPLHSGAGAVIGQLVGSGKLPLSIIDMADFEPGGLQRFFVDFAPALMKHARGVVYLVIEEAHEFAPKERAGIGAENLAIHWAKKLATAGRSKGIRLIVSTQRVQALHNAVLGSCETVITHRLTAPADQEPVIKWLKANTDKETQERVANSLSSLPTGTGWVCSGEAQIFEKVGFPKFSTYDNTATPTGDGDEIAVKTAAVDQDELRSIIGEAVKEAEANDPKALKAEVARLTKELSKAPAPAASPAELQDAEARGYERGHDDGGAQVLKAMGGIAGDLAASVAAAKDACERSERLLKSFGAFAETQGIGRATPRPSVAPKPSEPRAVAPAVPRAEPRATDGALTGPQRRILNALAWWAAFGIDQPTNEQFAFIAGYAPGSGNFNNLKGGLRVAGLLDYPSPGRATLTAAGAAAAETPDIEINQAAFHDQVRSKLKGPQLKLLEPVLAVYPASVTAEELAVAAGYAAGSGNFNNLRGSLRSIGLIDYPAPGQVRAADWLFPTGAQ